LQAGAVNILERSLEQAFDIDSEGRVVFYPFGMLSKGRLIVDRQTFESVRSKYVVICTVMLFAVMGIAIANRFVLSFEQALWSIAIALSLSAIWMQLLAMSLPFADDRFNARRAMQKAAGSHSIVGLVGLAVISWLFTTGGIIMLLVGDAGAKWTGLACTVIFGSCLAASIWMIVAKTRQGESGSESAQMRGSSAVSRNDRGRGGM
jgi:hypothetical protein